MLGLILFGACCVDQGDFGEGPLAGVLCVRCGEGDKDVEEVRFHC